MVKRLASIMIAAGVVAGGFSPVAKYAFAADVPALDSTAIEQDLADLDFTAYPKNEGGTATVVNFAEFGYASNASDSDYALYIYLYNPTEQKLSDRTGANTATLAIRYNSSGVPAEYSNVELTTVDTTDDFRFYKFRVSASGKIEEEARKYSERHSGERRYDLAGIQIWREGNENSANAQDCTVSATYYFSGYGAGFGPLGTTESTLQCRADKLETVVLDVKSTYWRSPYINQNGAGHYNQLSSVYFGIPKDKLKKYGKLYGVKCFWDERRTAPIIVTNKKTLYDEVSKNLGKAYNATDFGFKIFDNYKITTMSTSDMVQIVREDADWAYGSVSGGKYYWKDTTPVGYVFYSTQADILNARVSTSEMMQWVADKNYADYLFTKDVDEGRSYGAQEHIIYADKPFDMLSFSSGASGWDKFVNKWQSVFNLQRYDFGQDQKNITPIKAVTDSDFVSTDSESASKLFINEIDFRDFKTYYNNQKEKNDVFLLRFAATDYYSALQTVDDPNKLLNETESTYMARETVFLKFDIIELTFKSENGVETVLPVVSNPTDIIAGIDPPTFLDRVLDTSWVKYAFVIIIALLAVGFVALTIKREVKRSNPGSENKQSKEDRKNGKGSK